MHFRRGKLIRLNLYNSNIRQNVYRCLVDAFPPNVTYYWYQDEELISCKRTKDDIYQEDTKRLHDYD